MITSNRNPLVKAFRQLGLAAKHRKIERAFLIEGTHALTEAIANRYPLNRVCLTETWCDRYPDLYRACLAVAPCELVSCEVLNYIATTVNPDGVVASAPILLDRDVNIYSLGLALENVQDPGNVGAIMRSAVAVGVDGLLVSGNSVDLTNPKIIRATAGQWFRCPMQSVDDLLGKIQELQNQGMQAIATLPTAELTYWDLDLTQPSLIMLGNEGGGLSQELVTIADGAVRVPLAEGVESLNLAVTAALLLYEASRQRRSEI